MPIQIWTWTRFEVLSNPKSGFIKRNLGLHTLNWGRGFEYSITYCTPIMLAITYPVIISRHYLICLCLIELFQFHGSDKRNKFQSQQRVMTISTLESPQLHQVQLTATSNYHREYANLHRNEQDFLFQFSPALFQHWTAHQTAPVMRTVAEIQEINKMPTWWQHSVVI